MSSVLPRENSPTKAMTKKSRLRDSSISNKRKSCMESAVWVLVSQSRYLDTVSVTSERHCLNERISWVSSMVMFNKFYSLTMCFIKLLLILKQTLLLAQRHQGY